MARRARATVAAAAAEAREALLRAADTKRVADSDFSGAIVLYDLTPGFRGNVKKVAAAVAAEGLEPKHVLPQPPDWPVAFGRALEIVGPKIRAGNWKFEAAAEGKGGERRVGVVQFKRGTRVKGSDQAILVCPTSRQGQEAREAGSDAPPYIEGNVSDPSLAQKQAHKIAKDVLRIAQELFETFTIDDIRTAFTQHIKRWEGAPLKKSPPYVGYYVLEPAFGEIRKIRNAYASLGAGEIRLIRIHSSDLEGRKVAVAAVNDGLEKQLNDFQKEVDGYLDKPADSTRPSTVEALVEQCAMLRETGKLYRDMLGSTVSKIDEDIVKLEAKLLKHLGVVQQVRDERVAAAAADAE